jgi:hypothetical protein
MAKTPMSAAAHQDIPEASLIATATKRAGSTQNKILVMCKALLRRLTTKFSGGTPAYQHAGAPALACATMARPPAAEHFMCPPPAATQS